MTTPAVPARRAALRRPTRSAPRGVHLERIHPTEADWKAMDELPDRELFQTREWVRFVEETQNAEPVVAAVVRDGETAGYFTGLIVSRLGLRILASPMPGWTTPLMGFTMVGEVNRADAAVALADLAFSDLRCAHLELADRHLHVGDLGSGFSHELGRTFELPLGTDDEIFGSFTSACRRAVRKSDKVGLVVEEAHGEEFADEYHEQLVGVFARQGLAPTYDVDRVRALIRCLEPTGRLLLLRARDPEGASIATAIFPAFGGTAYFWGGASVREQQVLRPNEALFWYAMRRWRDHGVTTFDFGGGGDYKRRYGGTEVFRASFQRARFPGLLALRSAARTLVGQRQRLHAARIRPRGRSADVTSPD
jgi:CelD/BcsL family acetyltransferase involved in cellulose biosynthesis